MYNIYVLTGNPMANQVIISSPHRQPYATIDWSDFEKDRSSWLKARENLQRPLAERLVFLPRCNCKSSISKPFFETQEIGSALAATQSFADLCVLVRNAKVHLSFWGRRYIKVAGYSGTLPIDALAQRVLELVKQNPNFDQSERSHGKTIAALIDQFYDTSDQQVIDSSWLTKKFVSLRNLPNHLSFCSSRNCSKTRWIWKECETVISWHGEHRGYHKIFEYYTKEQHQKDFGPVKEGEIYGGNGPGRIYWAPEDTRRQMNKEVLLSMIQSNQLDVACAIEVSAACGYLDILKEVLQYGLNGKCHGYCGAKEYSKALVYAARYNHSECLKFLLHRFPDTIDADKIVEAANFAEFNGDAESVRLLKQYVSKNI